jgi:hypothetical protein
MYEPTKASGRCAACKGTGQITQGGATPASVPYRCYNCQGTCLCPVCRGTGIAPGGTAPCPCCYRG